MSETTTKRPTHKSFSAPINTTGARYAADYAGKTGAMIGRGHWRPAATSDAAVRLLVGLPEEDPTSEDDNAA